jgi:hypothetical protein
MPSTQLVLDEHDDPADRPVAEEVAPGGAAFGPDTHVAGSFNMLVAPFAGGFFVGDYEAIGVNGDTFLPFFVQTNCSDSSCTATRTDVYAGSC